MLVAMKKGQLILAEDVHNKDGYSCPGCGEPVILRRGHHKIAHFAHRPGSQCRLGEGETAEHLLGKQQLFQWYQQQGRHVELEVYLPSINQRPDLLLTDGNRRVAIEFQCSPLSLQRLLERNTGYRQCGICFHWLLGAPYQGRRLQSAKIAQFTQEVGGHPGLFFWDTRVGRLVVKRDLVRCSFIRHPAMEPRAMVKYQMRRLSALQYGRGQCPLSIRQLVVSLPGHRPLATCPLVCHDVIPSWPTLDEPVILWRIRIIAWLMDQPLFHYWSYQDWEEWLYELTGNHWLGYGCLDAATIHQQLITAFTNDLLSYRILLACPGGYLLFKYPRWFANVPEKINLLDRGGLLQAITLK